MADIEVKGIVFSTSAAVNDIYYRTDLGGWYQYTGAEWISQEYSVGFVDTTYTTDAASETFWVGSSDAIYSSRNKLRTRVSTTNDSDNYWTISLTSGSLTSTTGVEETTVYTRTTAADTPDVFTNGDGPSTDTTPQYYGRLYYSVIATGTPGVIRVGATMLYRFIAI